MYTTFFLAKKCHEKNIFPIFMHEKSRCDDIAAAFVCRFLRARSASRREMHVERDEEQDDGEGHCDEAAAFDEGLLLLVELCVALGVREDERDGEQRVHGAADVVEARPARAGDEDGEDGDGHEDVVFADLLFGRFLFCGLFVEFFLEFAILFCHKGTSSFRKFPSHYSIVCFCVGRSCEKMGARGKVFQKNRLQSRGMLAKMKDTGIQ